MVRNLSIVTLLALSLVFCATSAQAQQSGERRFEVVNIDGKSYLLDRDTGKLSPVGGGPAVNALPDDGGVVYQANPDTDQLTHHQQPEPSKNTIIKPQQPEPVASKPIITFNDGEETLPTVKPTQVANNVGSGITQKDREEAAGDISAYFNYLSTSMIVKQGNDGVTGNILIYNNGLRKIDTMEITLLVPMGEDYKTFRYVLQDGTKDAPPQPKPKNSSVSFPTYVKVNEASVPNGTGKCDVKITYIKFSK